MDFRAKRATVDEAIASHYYNTVTRYTAHDDGTWWTAAEFAAFAGITTRSARRILARAADGQQWQGGALVTRRIPSRGGGAGWALEVLASSVTGDNGNLPAMIAPTAFHSASSGAEAKQRYEIVRPVLAERPGSAERKRALEEASLRAGVSEGAMYAWIAGYEADGFAALRRKPREDAGRRRRKITAAWDAWAEEARIDETRRARIEAEITRYVRSLWAASTEYGEGRIALLASDKLAELTEELGCEGDVGQLKRICKLSAHFVRRERKYRAIAIHDQDAKQWHDKYRPRIRRTREGRWPMDIVVGDVHPMDVLLPRGDGSTFTAKLIAFLDWANNRIFSHPVFLEKGEGVRQEHVIEATVAMTQDPRWGVPQVLYLDNGSEYGCVDRMADALSLNTQVRALGDDPAFEQALLKRCSPIVRAQPYNAAAKAIEPMFRVLERGFFSNLEGWIGGNRLAKKTANVGREPAPYPHGTEAFLADLEKCLAAYHATPQSGALNGQTPNEAYNAAVDAGWQRMDIARGALLAAFGKDDFRTLRQGGFSYRTHRGTRWYTHPALQELGAGRRLHLRIPPYRDPLEIPVMDESGRDLLCVAAVDRPYDALDVEGAEEHGARLAKAKEGMANLRADVDPVDLVEAEGRRASRAAPARIPESAGTIRLDEGMEAIGLAQDRTPAERRAAEIEDEEISQEREVQARARFLRKLRATG